MTKEYNGWRNRQTWNVALWLNNDEPIYRLAVEYMSKPGRRTYRGFIKAMGLDNARTPDNIAWLGSRLDYVSLNEMMRELAS